MNDRSIRILLIEDEPLSAKITLRMLREAGLDTHTRSEATLAGGLAALDAGAADIALLDLSLPDSGGLDTVKAVCGRFPALPVIVMTGKDAEAFGLAALKDGGKDYLVKGQFTDKELARAIRYAAERKELLNEKEDLIAKLQDALKNVKVLTGLLPTCADCKKIRTTEGTWVQMESYISRHSDALFSHGFCDACYQKRIKSLK